MEKLENIIFYNLEKAIKAYRQFAQKNTTQAGFDITIDQWLVLSTIREDAEISQKQIAQKVFKDVASVTRIIDLLIVKGYLLRNPHKKDRRRFDLSITNKGINILKLVRPISLQNRKKALHGLTKAEIIIVQKILLKIISNVS